MTAIEHTFKANCTPTAAFEALTTRAGINGWWATNADIGEGEGAEHELRFAKDGNTVVMKFRVEQASPAKVEWTCTDNGNPVWPGTTLTWSIAKSGDGCEVSFRHAGFEEDQSPPFQMTAQGWKHFMSSLQSYLDTGAGQPS